MRYCEWCQTWNKARVMPCSHSIARPARLRLCAAQGRSSTWLGTAPTTTGLSFLFSTIMELASLLCQKSVLTTLPRNVFVLIKTPFTSTYNSFLCLCCRFEVFFIVSLIKRNSKGKRHLCTVCKRDFYILSGNEINRAQSKLLSDNKLFVILLKILRTMLSLY